MAGQALPLRRGLALRIQLTSSVPERHRYRLLLLEPDGEHVAALCVQQQGAGAPGEGGAAAAEDPALQVKMWHSVPLVGSRPMPASAQALGCNMP